MRVGTAEEVPVPGAEPHMKGCIYHEEPDAEGAVKKPSLLPPSDLESAKVRSQGSLLYFL